MNLVYQFIMWVKYTLNKMWTLFGFTGYLLYIGFVHLTVLFSESEFHIKHCLTYMYKDNIIDQLPGSVSFKKSADKIGGIWNTCFVDIFWHQLVSECRQLLLLKCNMHYRKIFFSFLFSSFLLIFPFWAVVTFYGFHVFLYLDFILWS